MIMIIYYTIHIPTEKENSILDLEMARKKSGVGDEELNKALELQKMSNSKLQDQITSLIGQARIEQDKYKNLEQKHMVWYTSSLKFVINTIHATKDLKFQCKMEITVDFCNRWKSMKLNLN